MDDGSGLIDITHPNSTHVEGFCWAFNDSRIIYRATINEVSQLWMCDAYGSVYNPEVFVKVYIAANGWGNMVFNHVTVDGVEIMSAHNSSGSADQSGTATLSERLVEHQYTGVGLP